MASPSPYHRGNQLSDEAEPGAEDVSARGTAREPISPASELLPEQHHSGPAPMSLTASGATVKGRHTFQRHESHRALRPPPSTASSAPAPPPPPQHTIASPRAASAGGGAAGAEGGAESVVVRVDSKTRWRHSPSQSNAPGLARTLRSLWGPGGGSPLLGGGGGGWGWKGAVPFAGGGGGVGAGWKGALPSAAVLSGAAYCVSSCSMILLNKLVLSGYHWHAQISLMLYQNLVSVSIVLLLAAFGHIQVEPLTPRLVLVWMPVNFLFVGMLVTSFFSLQFMGVAMVTILKNVTNLVTALGEMYFFRKRHSPRVWGSLFLMILSAVCGGITDLSFHPLGYTWQGFNCLFTAAYSLTLRRVMDTAKAATRGGALSEFSMVLLNNALSFPPAILMIFAFGEMGFILRSPLMLDGLFWAVCTVSGLLGLAISFTSMWFLHQTSPTTYSLVGSLNKIPLSLLGIVMFNAPTSVANVSSILFGCFAGVVFARAKIAG